MEYAESRRNAVEVYEVLRQAKSPNLVTGKAAIVRGKMEK